MGTAYAVRERDEAALRPTGKAQAPSARLVLAGAWALDGDIAPVGALLELVQSPQQPAASPPPLTWPLLEAAKALQEENYEPLVKSKRGGYQYQPPTAGEQAEGYTNCSTFMSEVIARAYGRQTLKMQVNVATTGAPVELHDLDDVVNNQADMDDTHNVIHYPDGADKRAQKGMLKDLVKSDDPRIQGASFALVEVGLADWVPGFQPAIVIGATNFHLLQNPHTGEPSRAGRVRITRFARDGGEIATAVGR